MKWVCVVAVVLSAACAHRAGFASRPADVQDLSAALMDGKPALGLVNGSCVLEARVWSVLVDARPKILTVPLEDEVCRYARQVVIERGAVKSAVDKAKPAEPKP